MPTVRFARHRTALTLAAWCLLHPRTGEAQESGTPARAEKSIDDVVEEAARLALAPGAVLAVVVRDSIALTQAYGQQAPFAGAAPLTVEDVFRTGALTPLVNGLAAGQLEAAQPGISRRPLGRVIPELPPELAAITLEQLLTHTAGLTWEVAVPGRRGADDLAGAARQLTRLDRMAEPGDVFSESRAGASLVGLALERLAGIPYDRLVDSLVFAPLGMERSAVRADDAADGVTPGWQPSASPDAPMQPAELGRDSAVYVPVHGMRSTVTDVARLAAALVSDGVVEGGRALGPGVARNVMTARAMVPGSADGIGLGVRVGTWMDRPIVRVSGGHGGHGVVLWALPNERIAVVVLANKSNALLRSVPDFVFRRLLGLSDSPARSASVAPPDEAALAELASAVGVYVNGGERLEILMEGGRPMLRSDDLLLELTALPNGVIGAMRSGQIVLRLALIQAPSGTRYLWHGNRMFASER